MALHFDKIFESYANGTLPLAGLILIVALAIFLILFQIFGRDIIKSIIKKIKERKNRGIEEENTHVQRVRQPAAVSSDIPTEATTFQYCIYCGEKIPIDAQFCMKCGRQLPKNK